GGFCHAQPGGQAAVAQIAADGGRGAAGADAADDPRRLGMRFGGELADDGLGDVVVAAPVGGGDREAELVEVAGAVGGVPVGARVHLRGVVDQVAVAAQRLYVGNLARRGGGGHHRGEGQTQQAREPGFGDRGAAGG